MTKSVANADVHWLSSDVLLMFSDVLLTIH
jgi:hypothetical protein